MNTYRIIYLTKGIGAFHTARSTGQTADTAFQAFMQNQLEYFQGTALEFGKLVRVEWESSVM